MEEDRSRQVGVVNTVAADASPLQAVCLCYCQHFDLDFDRSINQALVNSQAVATRNQKTNSWRRRWWLASDQDHLMASRRSNTPHTIACMLA